MIVDQHGRPLGAYWMPVAALYEHVIEIPGPAAHPDIKRWLGDVLPDPYAASSDETDWCAAYVHGVLKECGMEGTGKANARSYLRWGFELKRPLFGCLCVFWRESPKGWKGHVGFYLGALAKNWIIWGGNQSGGRVCAALYPPGRLLGVRWPTGHPTFAL